MLSARVRGIPAETGVLGRVDGRGEGNGRDAELSRASRDCISKADGRLISAGTFGFDAGEDVGV